MVKPRSKFVDYAVYVGFRVGICILQAMPPDLAMWIVETCADLAFRIDRRYRDVTIDNLRRAFPDRYSEAELFDLARGVYRHFACSIVEAALMARKLRSGNVHRHVDASECGPALELIRAGRPVIIVTAHFGNWELSAHWLGLAGIVSHLVARPIDNPYIDRWVRAFREQTGHIVLAKKGDVRRMAEALAAGGTICTLGDQDAGADGMYVDFFGQPASTHKAIARLALRSGAFIVVVGFQKTGGLLEYTIRVMDMIDPAAYQRRLDATLAITQRFTAGIEKIIRLDPAQYFWLHRRWKHQPPIATRAAA